MNTENTVMKWYAEYKDLVTFFGTMFVAVAVVMGVTFSIMVIASLPKPSKKVITPHAVYENADVLYHARGVVEIVTEEGERMTINGYSAIVWKEEEKP
jgi:uncharacterized membrane protein